MELDALAQTDWVVYCKPPFGGPAHVLKYLSRYTHRVAISNRRLRCVGDGKVRFTYRDYTAQLRDRQLLDPAGIPGAIGASSWVDRYTQGG
jgi:hypothetical protein